MSIAHSYRWVQRGVESVLYSHQCAWCGVKLPHGAVFARPDTAHRTSHGICPKCSAKQLERAYAAFAFASAAETARARPGLIASDRELVHLD